MQLVSQLLNCKTGFLARMPANQFLGNDINFKPPICTYMVACK